MLLYTISIWQTEVGGFMVCTEKLKTGHLLVKFNGRLYYGNHDDLIKTLGDLIGKRENIILDLSGLQAINSAVLSQLVTTCGLHVKLVGVRNSRIKKSQIRTFNKCWTYNSVEEALKGCDTFA